MKARGQPRTRVLVVDDEPNNRDLLSALLGGEVYETEFAESGEEAIRKASTCLPGVVLLDVMMPGLDGYETTRRLKALAGATWLPIVLVTGLGDAASRARGFDAGADEFITRPIDRVELLARLSNLDALRRERQAVVDQNARLQQLHHFQQQAIFLMVHDLKNPLAAIALNMGFAQSQLKNVQGVEEVQSALDDARSACLRLQRLIAEVLDTSRIEEGRLAPTLAWLDLEKVAHECLHAFERRAQDERFLLSCQAVPGRVEADAELVRRAVQSMLENAFKFTPAGGRIRLSARVDEAEAWFEVACDAPRLSDVARRTAFEKHVPPADQPPGTIYRGHGLYYVHLIAQLHGGRAELVTDPEMETAFRLVLPVQRSRM